MPSQRRNTLRTRKRHLSPKVAADPGRKHKFRQEKMQDRRVNNSKMLTEFLIELPREVQILRILSNHGVFGA